MPNPANHALYEKYTARLENHHSHAPEPEPNTNTHFLTLSLFGPLIPSALPVPVTSTPCLTFDFTLCSRYRELAEKEEGVCFVGRLASYKYFNMDQVRN